jgi:hypothetical protein
MYGAPKVRKTFQLLKKQAKRVGYLAWKWIHISLNCPMVILMESGTKNEFIQAGGSNCMHMCLIVFALNVYIPLCLGSRRKPFSRTSKALFL